LLFRVRAGETPPQPVWEKVRKVGAAPSEGERLPLGHFILMIERVAGVGGISLGAPQTIHESPREDKHGRTRRATRQQIRAILP
jgi:hypothetical protein